MRSHGWMLGNMIYSLYFVACFFPPKLNDDKKECSGLFDCKEISERLQAPSRSPKSLRFPKSIIPITRFLNYKRAQITISLTSTTSYCSCNEVSKEGGTGRSRVLSRSAVKYKGNRY